MRLLRMKFILFVMFCAGLTSACGIASQLDFPITIEPTPTEDLVVLEPTPVPPPPKTLFVCLDQEPQSLYIYSEAYLYGPALTEANAILQAVYDGPVDYVNYALEPVILERLPDITQGIDARFEETAVSEGGIFLNPITFQAENLSPGKPYLPSGCRSPECIETYQVGDVSMDRMVIDFHLRPGFSWSDGAPLTAADSVFSFKLDGHASSPTTKYLTDRTISYEAVDELATRWTGIPGFLDEGYQMNFWTPLPSHVLGDFAPEEIAAMGDVHQIPLGWGPYTIQEWVAGDRVVLSRNEAYFRAGEGLPAFDQLVYRFIGPDPESAVQQLLTGECDILDESLLGFDSLEILDQYQAQGGYQIFRFPGNELLRLDFNLNPATPQVPKVFADLRTRQAIAGCINREAISNEIFSGGALIPETYISPLHPDCDEGVDPIAFDPAGAASLLQEIGWQLSADAQGAPRVANGVRGILDGTELRLPLLGSTSALDRAVVSRIESDLQDCGVAVEAQFVEPDELVAPWPAGPAFGRGFTAVVWPWLDWIYPLCEMYRTTEIPGDALPFGINASGFSDPAYDQACHTMILTYPGLAAYQEAARQTQERFRAELPGLPLLVKPSLLAASGEMCGIESGPLAASHLWNIEAFDLGDACR
jgi:peptide/nickel transport system substrate-binding protein